jgi:hypothetical protein
MSGENSKRGHPGRAGAFIIAALISGCSSASSVVDQYQTTQSTTPSWSARVSSFFSGAKPGVSQPASPTPSAPEVDCPGVDIRSGASTLNITVKSDQATAGDVKYQLSFGQTARECQVQSGTMSIKVGVQGRAIIGPVGAPGTVEIPLRYAVVREGPEPKTVITKFKKTSAVIGPGQTHVQFVDIEEGLSFPLPPATELDAYVVYVGFDEIGERNERRPARSAKKPASRQQ